MIKRRSNQPRLSPLDPLPRRPLNTLVDPAQHLVENPGSRARRRGLALPVASEPTGRRTHGRTVSRRSGCATGSAALGGVVVLSPPATTTKRTTAVGRAWPTAGEVHASNNRVSREPRTTVGENEQNGVMTKTKKPTVRYALSPYVKRKLRSAPITPTTPARRKPTPTPATATRTSGEDGEDATPVRRQASVRRRQDHSRSLDKFYGYNFEELRNWLFQVEAIAEADDWDDNEKLRNARVALAGRASRSNAKRRNKAAW